MQLATRYIILFFKMNKSNTKTNTDTAPAPAGSNIPIAVLTAIKAQAAKNHADDYSTQLYLVERGCAAWFKLNAQVGTTCPTDNGADLERWEALQVQLQAALDALRRLVNCPDLNEEALSPESLKALDQADNILAAIAQAEGSK